MLPNWQSPHRKCYWNRLDCLYPSFKWSNHLVQGSSFQHCNSSRERTPQTTWYWTWVQASGHPQRCAGECYQWWGPIHTYLWQWGGRRGSSSHYKLDNGDTGGAIGSWARPSQPSTKVYCPPTTPPLAYRGSCKSVFVIPMSALLWWLSVGKWCSKVCKLEHMKSF